MKLKTQHFKLAVIASVLLFSACGPAASQAVNPASSRIPATKDQFLLRAVDAYSAADYSRVISLTDSLLSITATADSQLTYLGGYYGIMSRLALGVATDSIGRYLSELSHLVPEKQRKELDFLVRGTAVAFSEQPQSGPAIAYKIGVVLPLSGQFYEFGEAILEGVKLAVEEYNLSAAAGTKVRLDVRDDAGEPLRAVALGRALAADSTVAALIGSHGNEATLSLALVSASESIPLVCPTADAPGLDAIGNTIHVLNRTDPRLSATVAQASMETLKLHTFAVLAEQDERGDLLAEGFIDQVRAAGGTVVADLRYSTESSNFEDPMAFIQRYLPDAIYMTAKSDLITQLASQVHYYGMGEVQLIGGEYWDSERVIRMGGDYVDGGLFSSPFYKDSERLRWRQFKEHYEQSHRRPVNRFSAYGYDAAGIILASLENLPVSRGSLAVRMRSGREFDGATGIYTIDGEGRVERHYFVLRIVSGDIVPARMEASLEGAGEPLPEPAPAEPTPETSPN
ncbi:ABC transporter substrate-binding protein [Gemmatimonadota bacterium]